MIPASILDTRGKQVYSPLWPTRKSAASSQPCLASFQAVESETIPHLHRSPHQPLHTDAICTVKFTLRPFKLLDKESLTHTHSHRMQSQDITGLQQTSIIPSLVVSPAPFLYGFWIFLGFGQGFYWIYFLQRKRIQVKIVSCSRCFFHPLNSTGLMDMQYPETPVLCYQRQIATTVRKRRWRPWLSLFSGSDCMNRAISYLHFAF